MKKVMVNIFYLFIFLLGFTFCDKSNKIGFIDTNAKEASESLKLIMYNFQSNNKNSSTSTDDFNERFKIIHLSDIHLDNEDINNKDDINIKNLKDAIKFSNLKENRINAIVATGDFVLNRNNSSRKVIENYIKNFTYHFFNTSNLIPSFVCTGNHDSNMLTKDQSAYLRKMDIHKSLFEHINYQYKQIVGENYYYADVSEPNGKIIRFIGLDCTDQNAFDYNSLHAVCFTQKQINWLINTALKENISEKHSVIILIHEPLQSYSKDQSTYMCSGYHLYNKNMIPTIINAFQYKKVLNCTYSTNIKPIETIHINADFTNTPGEFICYLGGHTHTYAHFNVWDNPNQKQIMLLANTLSPYLQNNQYGYIKRDDSEKNRNSFSIYSIDTNNKKIYITYFGAIKRATDRIEIISYK